MNIHQRQRERDKAKRWWDQLSTAERNDLGDDLVLGSFNWKDWGLRRSPSSVFLNEVDELRIHWEIKENV